MEVDGQRAPVPVAIDVVGPVRSQISRVVEGALGWQVVAVDDPVLPPRYVLVDLARAAAHAGGQVPVALVVVAADDPAAAARAAQHATAVLDGAPDAATLEQLAVQTAAAGPAGRAPWCTLAAAAGGVGATTVATALAGLRAWRHGPTLLAARGPTHQDEAPTVGVDDLASPAVWAAATPAVGLPDLRVVRLRSAAPPADAGPVPVLLEIGLGDPTADVAVVRPDRAGLAAAAAGTGAVVVVGRGAVDPAVLRRAAADRPVVGAGRRGWRGRSRAGGSARHVAAAPGAAGRLVRGPSMTGSVRAGLRAAVERRVAADVDVQAGGLGDRAALRRAVARALAAEGVVAPPVQWSAMVRGLVDDLAGLGPLEDLLRDPTVTDVCCNGPAEVFVERAGRLQRAPVRFDGDDHLRAVLDRVVAPLGVRLDRTRPWVDTVLPGGVRLHALLPPLVDHVTVTLRRVPATVPDWEQLVAWGTLDEDGVAVLRAAVAARRNLVVCGPAGVGKTTLLARLLAEVGDDRVVVVQDAPELDHPAPHTVHLHVRPPSPDGAGGVDTRTLVRNALRMRPDRLVVGEVRGAEVADLLAAMNTGHHGSATTVHANSARDAVTRLVGMALQAGLPETAAAAQVATAVDVVVAMSRDGPRRRVVEVLEHAGAGAGRAATLWP